MNLDKVRSLAAADTACSEAVTWLDEVETVEDLWETCPDAEWMLWLAMHAGVDRKLTHKVRMRLKRRGPPHCRPPRRDPPAVIRHYIPVELILDALLEE